jgi:hypothetical protein
MKLRLKLYKTSNNKSILIKKSNAGGITLPDFKLYYRAITIKQHKTRHKTNATEDSDINPHSYSHPIFGKGAQNTRGEKTASSKNAGKTGYHR